MAEQIRLDDAHPDLAREPLAEPAHALDVDTGLGVAPFHGHAEAMRDLTLGVGQVGGALADALLEKLVVAREAAAAASRATSGAVTSMIVPLSKRSCAAGEETRGGKQAHGANGDEQEPPARALGDVPRLAVQREPGAVFGDGRLVRDSGSNPREHANDNAN